MKTATQQTTDKMRTMINRTRNAFAALLLAGGMFAQKPSIAVMNIDSKGILNDASETGYLVRLELEKTGKFAVMDRYEMADVVKANSIDISNCYSKTCIVETGKLLKVEKMMTGSVERFGEKIVISLRIIDVATGNIDKSDATEYLNLPELQKMVAISVKKMVGIEPDQMMTKLLVDYDVPIESPKNTLKLNGPRMGFATTLGPAYNIITGTNTSQGEFGMFPAMFQFGWQQEFQYISAGNFQALVENFVMVGGLESSRFIPSYSPMLGFRFGKGAWEFGFGPTFRLVKKADGYYDDKQNWHLKSDYKPVFDSTANVYKPQPAFISRIDSRGSISLSTGLVIAVGKTFRSGYLNIPVNIFVAPRKDGTTIGATVGFNIQKKKRVE